MATVQRANVILQISDEADVIQKYKDKGFDVIDSQSGKVLERAVPHDAEALRVRVVELERELEVKNAEIAKLKEAKKTKVIEPKVDMPKKAKTSKKKS